MAGGLIIGDVLDELAKLPADHFDCVVTSPPYWGLRDYGTAEWKGGEPGCDHLAPQRQGKTGARADRTFTAISVYKDECGKCGAKRKDRQIGLEPTMAEHLDKMVAVCAEIWRVLKPSGTFWLNYGDCYATSPAGNKVEPDGRIRHENDDRTHTQKPFSTIGGGLKPKDLCMIPNRLAIRLQEWGWWVRSEIVWAKPNPMPESVTDRPAAAHEKIWLLTKAPRYHYDNEAVRPDVNGNAHARRKDGERKPAKGTEPNDNRTGTWKETYVPTSRNLRNYEPAPVEVWEMATRPFPGAHFATFPPELVERCLLAGTSQKGCCAECGAPWERDLEKTQFGKAESATKFDDSQKGGRLSGSRQAYRAAGLESPPAPKTLGWLPSCQCNAAVVPARVLDPFGGAGTVGLVADAMGLDWTLIELNPEYAAMAEARIKARVAKDKEPKTPRCEETTDMFQEVV